MDGKNRIVLYRRLGASVSVALVCCIFPNEGKTEGMYSYPSPDEVSDTGAPSASPGTGNTSPVAQYHVLSDSPYEALRKRNLQETSPEEAADSSSDRRRLAGGADGSADNGAFSYPTSSATPRLLIKGQPPAQVISAAPAAAWATPRTPIVSSIAPVPPAPTAFLPPANATIRTSVAIAAKPVAAPAAPVAASNMPLAATVSLPGDSSALPPPQAAAFLPPANATIRTSVAIAAKPVAPPATPSAPAAAVAASNMQLASTAPLQGDSSALPPPQAAAVAPVANITNRNAIPAPAPGDNKNLALLAPAAGAAPDVPSASTSLPSDLSSLPPPATLSPLPPPAPLAPMPIPAAALAGAHMPSRSSVTTTSSTSSSQPGLTAQSKQIADTLPPEKAPHEEKKGLITLEREHKNALEGDAEIQEHEGVGIKISVRRPKADANRLLNNAYDSLMAGDQSEAIALYKQVLEEQPSNKLALLGLATTYHRAGQLQLARPLYGKLLAEDPHNMEGLNNFLVLLADESPQGAMVELIKLQHTHPTFSPIAAQIGIIYEKMGDFGKAAQAMGHAIELSPENLKYRYDMAIILDKQGDWRSASVFYQQLITANDRGEKIPANPDEIQKRLTFIRSNRPNT